MPLPPPAEARGADRRGVVERCSTAKEPGGKRAASRGNSAEPPALTPYELERQARIAANQAKLVSLGLDQPPDLLVKPAPAKRGRRAGAGSAPAASVPPPPPTRQSKRQRGEAPELQPLHRGDEDEEDEGEGAEAAAAQRRRARNVVTEYDAKRMSATAQEHDHLNGYRLTTMSEKQLMARAKKISNVGKLVSFIKLLESPEAGMPAVAEAARARLRELTGQGCA